jgi:hypothetical protein
MCDAAIDSESAANAEEIHLGAYNAAFYELGLRWHWDTKIYQDLQHSCGEKDRLQVYLETRQPHLLKAYDVEFLMNAIQAIKTRCYNAMITSGTRAAPTVDWAEIQKAEVGV